MCSTNEKWKLHRWEPCGERSSLRFIMCIPHTPTLLRCLNWARSRQNYNFATALVFSCPPCLYRPGPNRFQDGLYPFCSLGFLHLPGRAPIASFRFSWGLLHDFIQRPLQRDCGVWFQWLLGWKVWSLSSFQVSQKMA